MTFNKAKAEKQWWKWKEAEEEKLRQLGMDEESIRKLRQMDWEDFKEERRYREHLVESRGELEHKAAEEAPQIVGDIRQLFDSVEDERVLHILLESDKTTLRILLLKMCGFSVKEIAYQIEVPEQTVYTKINRLRKKIKN